MMTLNYDHTHDLDLDFCVFLTKRVHPSLLFSEPDLAGIILINIWASPFYTH